METPLGQLLTSRREALGLTQQEAFVLLVRFGAPIRTRQSVSGWETGRSVPGSRSWPAICVVYGVAIVELANAIAVDNSNRGEGRIGESNGA